MRKKWIYALMGIISALLVMLIIIQLVWLKNAAAAETRENQLHIEKALGRVEEQLRNTNYCHVSYGKAFVNPHEKFYVLRADTLNKLDTITMFYQSMFDTTHGEEKVMSVSFPFTVDIQLKSTGIFNYERENYYNERKEFYEKLMRKKFIDVFSGNKRIDSMFDMHLVDSLKLKGLVT